MISQLEEIKRNSIPCKNGMLVRDRHQGTITQTEVVDKPRCAFCTKNGMLAFIDEHGDMYITKWSSRICTILENEGYTKVNFQIPLGAGKVPVQAMLRLRFNAIFK